MFSELRNVFLVAAIAISCLLALLGVLGVSGVVRTYRNPTASMEPTLPVGARFVTMRATTANRGDLVAFQYPPNPRVLFGKRVVAIGGNLVEIRAKRLFVNGVESNEPYATHSDSVIYPNQALLPEPYRSRDWFGPFRVPAGTFFVLGDNRDRSSDSRYWGPVPQKNLRGRVILAFSWSRGFWKPS